MGFFIILSKFHNVSDDDLDKKIIRFRTKKDMRRFMKQYPKGTVFFTSGNTITGISDKFVNPDDNFGHQKSSTDNSFEVK